VKISNLIFKPEKWAQNCLGRTKEGRPIQSFNVVHRDGHELDLSKDAESFSLYGAVIKLYGGEGQADVFFKLSEAVKKYTKQKMYVAQFNDSPTTTYEDIKAVLEIANL
jgi:hypothetical protein